MHILPWLWFSIVAWSGIESFSTITSTSEPGVQSERAREPNRTTQSAPVAFCSRFATATAFGSGCALANALRLGLPDGRFYHRSLGRRSQRLERKSVTAGGEIASSFRGPWPCWVAGEVLIMSPAPPEIHSLLGAWRSGADRFPHPAPRFVFWRLLLVVGAGQEVGDTGITGISDPGSVDMQINGVADLRIFGSV